MPHVCLILSPRPHACVYQYTANRELVRLTAIPMLPKIANCLANRPFPRPFLTNSSPSVSKIAQIFAVHPLTNNIIIISDQNIGNDFHGSVYIDSYPSKPQKWLCGHRWQPDTNLQWLQKCQIDANGLPSKSPSVQTKIIFLWPDCWCW